MFKRIASAALATVLASITTPATADTLAPWQEKAVTLTKAEGKVIEARWSNTDSFWVMVDDDGSDRTGFAQYVCLILNDAGRPEGTFAAITVWDAKAATTAQPKQLGKAYCQ